MITDEKILIIGAGISGIGAARLLEEAGAAPVLYDANEKLDRKVLESRLPGAAAGRIVLGAMPEELAEEAQLVVLSPGVPVDSPLVERLRAHGAKVWSEVELAWRFGKGRVAAITGTNGKTTTTALTGEILKTYYEDVFVVGNIGESYTAHALEMTENCAVAAEISSFQLEAVEEFRPDVSAILNITPDHLNRHHTMECYIRTKEMITKNQGPAETCVLNYEDEVLRDFGRSLDTKVVYFSSARVLDEGVCLDGADIIFNEGGQRTKLCSVDELKLLGRHNYENVMAAAAVTRAMGVPFENISRAVKNFTAVEHRIEFVAEKQGVAWYNDSKGTNTDASIKAVEAMVRPTVLIGGGYDKQAEFDGFIEAFGDKVKELVLIGETAAQIAQTAKRHGFENIIFADGLKEAVGVCARDAKAGDAVLLSPACASWDMFDNYEQRGRLFKQYVQELPD